MLAYGNLRDNNTNDLLRLADNYNANQRLKNLETQSPDQWDVLLEHISKQMRVPLTMSHLWQPKFTRRNPNTKMERIAATAWTAVRTRPGTSFYNYLLEKKAQEKQDSIPGKNLNGTEGSV